MDVMEENKKIKGKECRFAVYVPPLEYDQPDLHVVKEIIHYEDGTSAPKLNFLYDYKRPIWVAKKGCRNYEQKKEWESVDKLIKIETTQTKLVSTAAKALGMHGFNRDLRTLSENPYLYGSDITSTAIIKKAYMDKYPNVKTPFSIGVIDIETDVVHGTGEIIMLTFTMKDICITAITKKAVSGYTDVQSSVKHLTRKHLGKYLDERKIEQELFIVENEIDVITTIFNRIHEIKPDFVAIWNLDFELTKFIEAAERAQVDLKDILSDPDVPPEYRYFNYKRGKKQKVTSSGKITPIKPAAQWHTVIVPASFYFIDSMCAYKHTRMGKQDEQSYSLDAILTKELNITKLKLEQADEYTGLKWHQVMQSNFMLDYIVYNRFDCISMEILEEKIKDLSVVVPLFSGTSDFENFKSQPRRTVDALHWFVMERNLIMGTTSSNIVDDFDDETLSREDWIITLPAPLISNNGLKVIEENSDLSTTVYGHVGD